MATDRVKYDKKSCYLRECRREIRAHTNLDSIYDIAIA